MQLHQAVTSVFERFCRDDAMNQLSELTLLDRFQASRGLETAAERIAELAEVAGLVDVSINRVPADGERRWWTFRTPMSWTPLHARLDIVENEEWSPVTSYPKMACSLATNSAPTSASGVRAPLRELRSDVPDFQLRGAIAVLCPGASFRKSIVRMEQAGAIGFVASVASSGQYDQQEQVGRIELDGNCSLFGFSVSPSQLLRVREASQRGLDGLALVEVDRTAMMPVVEGVLPGTSEEEILLMSHSCHTRPGANDNLSGVTALLGLAKALGEVSREETTDRLRGIRFLWGPEFVATAAYLHRIMHERQGQLPICGINFDMVGENQQLCGGPLIVERVPDYLPGWLDILVQRSIELLPKEGRSYSGAVPTATWSWQMTPFVGASDHSLLVDRFVGCPAVMLGHWPDRFNHTSEDTLDKVDLDELRRSAAAGGAAAMFLSTARDCEYEYLRRVVAQTALQRLVKLIRDGATSNSSSNFVDPFSAKEFRGFFASQVKAIRRSLEAVNDLGGPCESDDGIEEWFLGQASGLERFLPPSVDLPQSHNRPALQRRFSGPFNLLGLIEQASPNDRDWIEHELAADRASYPVILALVMAIDGASHRDDVIRHAAWASQLPVRRDMAIRFLALLERLGWIIAASQ